MQCYWKTFDMPVAVAVPVVVPPVVVMTPPVPVLVPVPVMTPVLAIKYGILYAIQFDKMQLHT